MIVILLLTVMRTLRWEEITKKEEIQLHADGI